MEFKMLEREKKYLVSIFCSLVLFSANSFAADSLSYSGRLVKADGSPVAGPVNLKIDLAYTSAPGTVLCSQDFSSVPLSNGVFHLKLDLVCPGPPAKTMTEILTAVPATFSAALRVSDVSNNKIYAFQEIHSMPFSTISETAKQLAQLGAVNGEVLKWNDTTKKWEPGTPGGGGTVTSVSGTLPISVATGSSTPVISMTEANTSTSGYLSSADWNTFNTKEGTIAGGSALQYYRGDKSWQTLNTSVVPESGVTNLYFSNARALGVPLDGFVAGPGVIVATDTVLQAFAKTQGQINSLNTDAAKYLIKNNTDSITGVVSVGTTGLLQLVYTPMGLNDATNKAYVDSRDDTKLNLSGGTLTGDVSFETQIKLKDGATTNYVTLKAPASGTTSHTLTLPGAVGASGQVLTMTGTAGVLAWGSPATTATPTGAAGGDLSGTYPNPSITALDATKISGGTVDNTEFNALNGVTSSIQTQLNAKEAAVGAGTTVQYYRGDKSWQALDTLAVPENSRLYFTEPRVLGTVLDAFSASNAAIVATDSVLTGFNKAQGQISNLNSIKANAAGDTFTGDVVLNTQLKLKDGATTNYVTLKAPASGTTSHTLTLPGVVGASGQVLTMTGTAGVLSWSTPATSGTPSGAASGDLSGTYPAPTITALAATKISNALVDNAEFDTLNGVTSSIQTQLNNKQPLDATLTSLSAHNSNGILVQTAADTFIGRSITGTANRIAITNGDGVLANPSINLDTTLLPSPLAGDAGKFLKASGANASAWSALGLTDITTALGFTPLNKAGDSISAGTFTFSGSAVLRALDPVAGTDVANKQYVDSYGLWTKSASDVYRASGNVGIGTTSPLSKLHVVGSGNFESDVLTNITLKGYSNVATDSGSLTLLKATGSMASSGAVANGNRLGTIWFGGQRPNGTNINSVSIEAKSEETFTNTSSASYMSFNITPINNSTRSEVMRLSSGGNVGIGTTAPAEKLEIAGRAYANSYELNASGGFSGGTRTGIAAPAAVTLGLYSNGNERMRIDGTGNVGIGTDTPGSVLEIGKNTAISSSFRFSPSTDQSAMRFTSNGAANWIQSGSEYIADSKKDLRFSSISGTTTWMSIQGTTGNVGIGTTAPGSALDVKGTLRLSGSTSGYVGFAPAAAAGATTYTLPITQGTSGQVLSTNGVATTPTLSWVSVTLGTVTSVTSANTDITVATATTTPVLTLNSGTGANQIVKLNGSSQLPAVNGSLLTSLNPANLSGAVSVAKGGTGLTAGTSGGIPYFNTTTTMASSALLGLNGIMLGGGAGAAPTTLGTGVAGQFLKSAGASAPAWANLAIGDLKSSVAGNLFPGSSCGAAQTLVYSIVTDSFTCTNLPASATYWSAATGGINYASGNVGIGTTGPTESLQVNGNVRIGVVTPAGTVDSPGYGSKLFLSGGPAQNGRDSDNSDVIWLSRYNIAADSSEVHLSIGDNNSALDAFSIGYTNGAWFPFFKVQGNGNVGIGTSTPDRKFQVTKANASSSIRLDGFIAGTNMTPVMGSGSDFGSLIEGADSGQVVLALRDNDNNDGFRILSGGGNFMTDSIYDTAVFTALSNGNVGIGTTSPAGSLHVVAAAAQTNSPGSGIFLGKSTGLDYQLQLTQSGGTPHIDFSRGTNTDFDGRISSSADNMISLGTASGGQNILNVVGSNVGIGTTSPAEKLHVVGDMEMEGDVYGGIYGGTRGIWRFDRTNSNFGIFYTEGSPDKMQFATQGGGTTSPDLTLAGGKVGIGTTVPVASLHIVGGILARGGVPGAGGANNNGYAFTGNSGDNDSGMFSSLDGELDFFTDSVLKMKIMPSGNVGIGTSTPGYRLDVQGGNVNSAGAYTNVSDRRLKQEIRPLKNSLDKILQLEGVNYYWKDQSFDSSKQVGFIAQEVEKVFPEVVKTDSRGFKAMSYSQLVSPVVSAIKELFHKWLDDSRSIHREMASIKAENKQLKQENEAIKNYLCDKDPKAVICK